MYHAPGIPEDQERTRDREERKSRKLRQRSEGQFSPEMGRLLDAVDFSILHQLFLKRTGEIYPDNERLNFIGKDRIFGMCGGFYSGYFDVLGNTILLAEESGESEEGIRDVYGSKDIYLLARLTHEEAHAVSKNICCGLQNEPEDIAQQRKDMGEEPREWFNDTQSGYFRESNSGQQFHGERFYSIFHAFNEGVVEKLSREIVSEYLEKIKWQNREAAVLRDSIKKHHPHLGYSQEVELVEAILRHLAVKTDRSEIDIWNSFVHGLMNGETFDDTNMKTLFSEAFGPDFLKELSKIHAGFFEGNREKMQLLFNKYKLS